MNADIYFLNRVKDFKRGLTALLPLLSVLVILVVFWWLKLTGITLAGEAFCGVDEHVHTDECYEYVLICTLAEGTSSTADTTSEEKSADAADTTADAGLAATDTTEAEAFAQDSTDADTTAEEALAQDSTAAEAQSGHVHTEECYVRRNVCTLPEHIHVAACYSDITADLETADDWEMTLADVPRGLTTAETVVEIARSQLGYTESTLNFEISSEGERHGYTRYGEWYGNPYGSWSSMFVSFCLRYAGAEDVPINSGAEVMRTAWDEKGLYREKNQHIPTTGNIMFLDKNGNGSADAAAVVTGIEGGYVYAIEGDLEGAVAESEYREDSSLICGYGIIEPGSSLMLMATDGLDVIAKTTAYNTSLFTETNSFIVYTKSGDNYYAFDGNGKAVQIFIDTAGNITSNTAEPSLLLWSFTYSATNSYLIQNTVTGKYMHAFPNNGTGVITTGAYPSTVTLQSDGTVKIRSNNEYARLSVADMSFQMTQNQSLAAGYNLGIVSRCTVWLDGTCGGLMSLAGAANKSYTVQSGDTIKLPEEWQSPEKYAYKVRGWYDIKNKTYYAPGDEVEVSENLVFYPDWVAATYDIGEYNAHVTDTVSTEAFITTRVFDYNALFNLMSEKATVTVSPSGHSESWSLVQSGEAELGDTLNFIFMDYDANGDISYPSNKNSANTSGGVYSGLYSDALGEILFSPDNVYDPETGTGIIGKTYLGEGDHLLRLNTDPQSEYYGYYYYDSRLNAASYNQTDGRFYVYDYLERTADSAKDGGDGEFSDFLPFNSPYANTNGKNVGSYTYDGLYGEYPGVSHFQYDAKYNSNNNSTANVGTNYWFGMSMETRFYLPEAPGSMDSSGKYGNQDIYGKDMHFKFSGDDDVWVLVDGKLVLDLGGIHGVESGDINFATGVVTVNGTQVANLSGIGAGDHTLTVYYLERGSSQSNCAIYFNLAPRFGLTIQKEDVLTRDLLNGAEFSVFTDKECSVPAELWESEEDYNNGLPAINTFTIENGTASMWGMGAGNTYYIRETKPPIEEEYSTAYGIICVSLDKRGTASYSVEIISETDEDGNVIDTSPGFTVHGFKIDEENQQAFIVVTNAKDWVRETTSVQVMKRWNDTEDHTYDSVTVYLNVTDVDGTVRRIREITLSEANDWKYSWTNLPKYLQDGKTEVQYSVSEAYFPGYSPHIQKLENGSFTEEAWQESAAFQNGEVYVLKTEFGCLSAQSAAGDTLCFVDEETAKNSPLALWTATVSNGLVRLTNQAGQSLNFDRDRWRFNATGNGSKTNLTPSAAGAGLILASSTYHNQWYTEVVYLCGLDGNGYLGGDGSSGSALVFHPLVKRAVSTPVELEGYGYTIANTPLTTETSVKVTKRWDHPLGDASLYEKEQVTIKLLANGADTGRTVTLNLKNGWTDTFLGLPYTDAEGNIITYTVQESWENPDWLPVYGEIVRVQETGELPRYETEVTNSYRWGHGYEMPSTGGCGRSVWILSGMGLMTVALVSGYVLRRKRERRYR